MFSVSWRDTNTGSCGKKQLKWKRWRQPSVVNSVSAWWNTRFMWTWRATWWLQVWWTNCKAGEKERRFKQFKMGNSKNPRTRNPGTFQTGRQCLAHARDDKDWPARPDQRPACPDPKPPLLMSTSVLRGPRDERLCLPVPVERSPSYSESPASGLIESAPVVELMPSWLLSVFEIKSLSHWMKGRSLQSNNPLKTVQGFRLQILETILQKRQTKQNTRKWHVTGSAYANKNGENATQLTRKKKWTPPKKMRHHGREKLEIEERGAVFVPNLPSWYVCVLLIGL